MAEAFTDNDVEAAARAMHVLLDLNDRWAAMDSDERESYRAMVRAPLAAVAPGLVSRATEPLRALIEMEIADDLAANVRRAVGDLRCLDCNLRYDERQDYGCGQDGRGHDGYTPEMIAEAEAEAMAEGVEYVTLSIADLRAALSSSDPATEADPGVDLDDETLQCANPNCSRCWGPNLVAKGADHD